MNLKGVNIFEKVLKMLEVSICRISILHNLTLKKY